MANTSKLTGSGIAVGAALGAVFGVFAGHMAAWLAVAIVIGVLLGASLRKEPECAECAAMHKIHETKLRANS